MIRSSLDAFYLEISQEVVYNSDISVDFHGFKIESSISLWQTFFIPKLSVVLRPIALEPIRVPMEPS